MTVLNVELFLPIATFGFAVLDPVEGSADNHGPRVLNRFPSALRVRDFQVVEIIYSLFALSVRP